MAKIVVIGGGWSGCAAAIAAKKAGADVLLLEKTDLLLGLGNVGGIMRNNGRYSATEEAIALGARELFEITDKYSTHRDIDFPGHSHATIYNVTKIEKPVRDKIRDMGIEIRFFSRVIDVKREDDKLLAVILEDGENIGIESEEIVINQDIEGPKVEFANTDDGESGNQEYQIKAEVRVTVIDESGIDENSLKYTWVKFNTKEEYEEFINGNKTIEELKEKMMENSKSFANGEPIVIKNSEKGVYSLFIYSKDTLGNETVNISNPYYIYKDNQGPNITFNNTQDGGNGNSKWETTAKVNVNVTDESGVDENSLKYEWVIFNSKEEYETFIKENTEIEKLKNKMQNQTMFLNGQELIISSEERKIYSLFVYAKDTVGNENISISNPYYIGNSKQDEASYEVKENYIINVIPETKVEEFIEKVKNTIIGENYNLYDNNKEQIKYDSKENQNNNSDKTKDNQNENLNSKTNFVATGDILKVDEKEYTVIVLGDLNSDGLLNVIDLAKLKKYITEIENLDEKYKLSADINQDETVNIIDSVRAKQYITGLRIFEEN